ncbi:MAG: copper amine oxidase N-terminal domain-containing protein [Caldiserica bacterium]|nr:copper amine oxidase N-terminal domain-containing protein [Caldisericota bacterium]
MKKKIAVFVCFLLLLTGTAFASTLHPIEHVSPIRDASWVRVPFSDGVGSSQWETDRGLVQAETAYIIDGRTYVPFRWSVELFGGEATWSSREDGTTEMVYLYKAVPSTEVPTVTSRLEVCGPRTLDLSAPLFEPVRLTLCGVAAPLIPVEFRISQVGSEMQEFPLIAWAALPEPSGFFFSPIFFGSSPYGLTVSLAESPEAEPLGFVHDGTLSIIALQAGEQFQEVLLEVKEDWRPYGPISRDDFKGEPPPENEEKEESEAAEIGMRVGYDTVMRTPTRTGTTYTATVGTLTTYAVMDRNSSWMRPGANDPDYPRLLNHEQKHFDLAQAFAKKLKKVLEGLVGTGTTPAAARADLEQKMNKAYNDLNEEWQKADAKYDEETKHGTDAAKQQEWDAKIAGWAQNGYP